MPLPTDFQFSQASLQDYVDCPRRFQLRHVRRLRWPAAETAPALENERYLRQGKAFHRLIHQHLAGIPLEALSRMAVDPELRHWWSNYLESGLADVPSERYPELTLSSVVNGHRLVARYDLIALGSDGTAVIVDWKTNRKRPSRAWLLERLQTRVYLYVLAQCDGEMPISGPVEPDRLTLIYWFANYRAESERIAYTEQQCQEDEAYLLNLVMRIEEVLETGGQSDLLPPARDGGRCRLCRYRSLCQRGVRAGWADEMEGGPDAEEPFGFTIDFEQIAELEAG